jgi:formylglycine-generating enzyme required for sulfatase activity
MGMKFVLVPPGEFLMGSTPEERDRALEEARSVDKSSFYLDKIPSESPPHRVRITQPFYLGVYEVTQEEYERLSGQNPSQFSAHGKEAAKVSGVDTRRLPVEHVPFDDARQFAVRLGEAAPEKSAGRRYRLPTEAEWEHACRAGTATRYYFGDDRTLLADHGWFRANCSGRSQPVGSRQANAWGLHDLYGNALEWCQDWFSLTYYAESPPADPQGPSSGSWHVERGGMTGSSEVGCRSAARHFHKSTDMAYNAPGFRLVCEIPRPLKPQPAAASSTPAAAQQPRQTIDLLALTDPVRDRVKPGGKAISKANFWERQGDVLVQAR